MTDEETRAAEYRAGYVRLGKFVAAQVKGLRGSDSSRRALEQRWAAVVNRTRDTSEENR